MSVLSVALVSLARAFPGHTVDIGWASGRPDDDAIRVRIGLVVAEAPRLEEAVEKLARQLAMKTRSTKRGEMFLDIADALMLERS